MNLKVNEYKGMKRVSISTMLKLNKCRKKNNQPSYSSKCAAAWELYKDHQDGLYVTLNLSKSTLKDALALLERTEDVSC